MYIRTTSRTNKDGSVTRYVQLAHNERHVKTGQPQAKVLYNFGRMDELHMDTLKRLAASISRFLGEEPATPASSDASALTLLRSQAFGGSWLLGEMWRKLGIGRPNVLCISGAQSIKGLPTKLVGCRCW